MSRILCKKAKFVLLNEEKVMMDKSILLGNAGGKVVGQEGGAICA